MDDTGTGTVRHHRADVSCRPACPLCGPGMTRCAVSCVVSARQHATTRGGGVVRRRSGKEEHTTVAEREIVRDDGREGGVDDGLGLERRLLIIYEVHGHTCHRPTHVSSQVANTCVGPGRHYVPNCQLCGPSTGTSMDRACLDMLAVVSSRAGTGQNPKSWIAC